jgi:drug/metabolite transporter (DMT)-like permease
VRVATRILVYFLGSHVTSLDIALSPQAIPFLLLQGFIWGTTLLASRFGVGQFHPLTYIGIRMILASLGHIAVYIVMGRRSRPIPKDRRLWSNSIVLGVFGTAIPIVGIVSSLQYLSSGMTSIMITVNPALTVLLAHFLLPDEPLSRRKAIGVGLAISGALLLALRGETGLPELDTADWRGYVLVLTAMVFGSVMNIYARRTMQDMDAFDVGSIRMLTAAAAVFPLAVLVDGLDFSAADQSGWAALGYAAVAGTFLGMLLAFYIIQRFGATTAAMTSYVIPIVASIGGMLFLNELITSGMLAGMGLIGLGIALINDLRLSKYPTGSA